MSEEKRKNARTQNRYSAGDKDCSSKWQEKRSPKMPSSDKNKGEKRKSPIVGSRAQTKTDLQFDENSNYSFKDLEPLKRPQKIKFSEPVYELSNTINGISRLIYYPDFMKFAEASNYFDILLSTTSWHDKNIVIKGVEYPQPRLVAWYGPHPYTYAGATLEAKKMPNAILEIKEKIEATLRQHDIKVELNSVLLNLYRNEKDSVAWHSDDELSLGIHPTIASVSLGATRKFEIRPKEHVRNFDMGDIFYVDLIHGSLIIMDGYMQKDWQHRVPKEYHSRKERINLTFRTIYPFDKFPPEMPCVSNMKYAKSPSEKVLNHQDPKFDSESFPPLGMETSDKKTKLLPKENDKKDYKQSVIQRRSPKEYCEAIGKKPKFVTKRNNDKGYQKSVIQNNYQKEENWDDKMLQNGGSTPTIWNNQNSSCDSIINSPEFHQAETDQKEENWNDELLQNIESTSTIQNNRNSSCDSIINSPEFHQREIDLKEKNGNDEFLQNIESKSKIQSNQKLCCDPLINKPELHSSKIGSKSYDYSDSSKMYQLQNYESSNSHFYESEDSGISKSRSVDFNSNNEDIAKFCEFQLESSKTYQSHEPTDSHFLESKGPSLSEKKPFKIKSEFVESDANISDSGKISMLNANAPDFIPQNKFENFSLSDLAEYVCHLKTEEFRAFAEEIFKHLYADDSPLFYRDFHELDVYYELMEDGSLSDKHVNIILKRICSIVKHVYKRLNDTRHKDRYVHRSFDENSRCKYKQSYGRSQRY